MARIEFDGEGVPIPALALPPFGGDTDVPPTTLTFIDDVDFSVSDYRALGFTHFEVWCVGAAGGRGGDATSQIVYAYEEAMRPVSQAVWNFQLELMAIDDYFQQVNDHSNDPGSYAVPLYNRNYKAGSAPGWYADVTKMLIPDLPRWSRIVQEEFGFFPPNAMVIPPYWEGRGITGITYAQAYEMANPSHQLKFTTYKQVALYPTIEGLGGGGGGGGFHKVSGLLADLDDVVPIIVGKAGADAGYGHIHQNGDWTPDAGIAASNPVPPASPLGPGSSAAAIAARRTVVQTYLTNYVTSYPEPRTSFSNPQSGVNGGASSFAGDICQASGGEGGDPGQVWNGSAFVFDGDGGAGGIGGSLDPGGGGLGSVAEGVNGEDGVWHPETGIGAGGGGGKGGRAPTGGGPPFFTTPVQHLATAGGQGSYSFGDTSVYGARQFRQPWTYLKPVTVFGSGIFTFIPVSDSANLVTAGGGGGARPFPNMKYGGRGADFSPNGVVVIRLTKIT